MNNSYSFFQKFKEFTVHSGSAPGHKSKIFVTPNGAVKHEGLGYSAIDYSERILAAIAAQETAMSVSSKL